MWQQSQLLFLLCLVLSSGSADGLRDDEEENGCTLIDALPYMVVGGAALMYAGPAVLATLGFQATGIAAGSVGSWLMSWSAISSGGGVPAGGVVATLQSLGAQAGSVAWGSIGSKLGYTAHQNFICGKKQKSKKQ
ncbi:interferon alpha-inducible protein 6 [Chelonoidis abingdonii]|uniref:Interferon alpha inducible protein 6 n=1 Tax=Chelonoidis abingdonii TaxID=106734 RepID=A0A8C0GRB7_CHEAB|nr:interferon alpha-inducible protein 6 [Chelonoidis abingdonii]